MGDVDMTTPTKANPRRLVGTPVTRTQLRHLAASKKLVTPNVEYSLRSSSTRDLFVHSPSITPRRPLKQKSPSTTPSSAQRHGINLQDYNFDESSNLMRTPTRNGIVSPPPRPSKRRTRILRLIHGEPKSLDIVTASQAVMNDEDSPGSRLAKVMENCSIQLRRVSMCSKDRKSPPRTPRSSRKPGNKVSRVLHRVQAKISK